MKGALLALGTVVVAGCVSVPSETGRSDVIRRLLPSAVQLRAEGDGGVRRAGTGVVVGAGFDYSWVLTTRHLLAPQTSQNISAAGPGLGRRTPVKLWAVSTEADLALLRIDGVRLPAVPLKDSVRLGDDVWVIAFPWGRRLTVVSGVVSQLVVDEAETAVEGAVRMVDASVSYGSSGGGVFDHDGTLIGIVEGYRTAEVALPQSTRAFQIPSPGETQVISAQAVRRFLEHSGLPPSEWH